MGDLNYMKRALFQAEKAYHKDEVPVGAVVILDDQIISEAHNNSIKGLDPSGHAEIEALKKAALVVGNYRIKEAVMYVTLEPCMMCCGALVQARLAEVVFAARDPKSGVVVSNGQLLESSFLNHKVRYRQGPLENESSEILKRFFASRRS
ncbi:MAG TPA: nucleoside deaminase [Gammaproteobacteria bacterium]|jgi:tRNA(adenine34) deaminase|nr:nucleoside deaminase [Gammaproteobacteria bacterium]HIK71944.1 nucleoside deaminase [Gammaproteobacteria bacterium]